MPSELVVVSVLLVLGSLPLLGLSGRLKYVGLLLWAAVVIVSAIVGLPTVESSRSHAADEKHVTHRPIEVQDRGFVSSRSCRACHPNEYGTWYASYHRTMTQVASEQSIVGDFENITLPLRERSFRLFRRDNRYWVEIQDEQDATKFKEHEIVMTTGSHHMQFYWFANGTTRELGKLPFVFLFSEQRWVPADSTFLSPPGRIGTLEAGQWNQSCVNCHATGGQPRLKFAKDGGIKRSDLQQVDTHVAEFGIACEACHGPSEKHVRANGNPGHRYAAHLGEEPDQTVIHPESLAHRLSSQVCGQCHGISLPQSNDLMRRVMWDGFRYRPGDDLHGPQSDRIIARTDLRHPMIEQSLARDPAYLESSFWSDGMVRVAGREYNGLINSPCFQHQDEKQGVMSCISCHEMHPDQIESRELEAWADDQLKAGMRDDEACLQCHSEYRGHEAIETHTHHDRGSAGSRCYNCHMPHTTYGLLKGIRSHTVSKPNVAESVFVGRPNACNLCHLDKTLRWTASYLEQWYGQESPTLTREQETTAGAVIWTLRGDAGQRALLAWHMGWQPAVKTSQPDWMPPYLAILMEDSYDAIRYIAYHALLEQSAFKNFAYDYMDPQDRTQAVERVSRIWARADDKSEWVTGDHLLIRGDGTLIRDEVGRILGERDNRPVWLNE